MMDNTSSIIRVAFMNIRGQTGLDLSKQFQIEKFIQTNNVDILNCQEINIVEDSFSMCNYITSSYEIISNNASNKYGTCAIINNDFSYSNVKMDTYHINNITFGNVYLPSGNDPVIRNKREDYCGRIIPQLLINQKDDGVIGGDWNCIVNNLDATNNQSSKMSACLKRVIKNFNWTDSFRSIYPTKKIFSRYYDHHQYGEGATRIDRSYQYGRAEVIQAQYVGVAFSDHFSLIITLKVPEQFARLSCPRSRPLFKAKPEVVTDPLFKFRLAETFSSWAQVKDYGLDILTWWELIVKPGVKKLLIERGKELNKERSGVLNLLLLRQSYLVMKVQAGHHHRLGELKTVQMEIEQWHSQECEKVKLLSKTEEIDSHESVRIHHHELHSKQIKKTSITRLQCGDQLLEGHDQCAQHLEQSVAELLLQPAHLDEAAQALLLQEVDPVFTRKDNELMMKIPDKEEVKQSIWSSNLHAAPGSDGLTSFLYQQCWDILGDSLTEVVQSIHKGKSPTLSQRTSLMVFGSKPKKPNSIIPSDKRRISLLNADFKTLTGIDANRLKKVATHTLSPCQLSAGDDRRIHHGVNKARDAIWAAGQRGEGCGILDNDYKAAFDYMVLLWVFKVLAAKGLDMSVIERLKNIYNDNITIVVVNNIMGKSFKNLRLSIRQGDRPSSILFNFGIDPHLTWLDRRLKGIPIYKQPAQGPLLQGQIRQLQPLQVQETYKVIGYVDDVKPSITSMNEFILVDKGSSLFEKASGCILHRDPASGKVKLLPLGRWKGVLQQEDLPVKYIRISDHLDMVGVQLSATFCQTRQVNGEKVQERVKNVVGPWKGGKFMPLVQRPFSVNSFCVSKI